jgi:acylphosphatase
MAERLQLSGYVRNLRDGRVEVYVIGAVAQLAELSRQLERGPLLSRVTEVKEELASLDSQYENGFVIHHEDWG